MCDSRFLCPVLRSHAVFLCVSICVRVGVRVCSVCSFASLSFGFVWIRFGFGWLGLGLLARFGVVCPVC